MTGHGPQRGRLARSGSALQPVGRGGSAVEISDRVAPPRTGYVPVADLQEVELVEEHWRTGPAARAPARARREVRRAVQGLVALGGRHRPNRPLKAFRASSTSYTVPTRGATNFAMPSCPMAVTACGTRRGLSISCTFETRYNSFARCWESWISCLSRCSATRSSRPIHSPPSLLRGSP